MGYRGWMFIGFSKDYPKGKIKARTFQDEQCLVFRTESGALAMVEPYCSHFGVNMTTGKVVKEHIQCPMHGRTFFGDGKCTSPRHRPIRSYPLHEERGLVFGYFDEAGTEPQWEAPAIFDGDEYQDVLWSHSRTLSLHHPSVPMDNAVDPRHFEFTHMMFGRAIHDGIFEPDGHKAIGTMSTELTPPLSYVSGDRADVVTRFEGPLNTFLQSKVAPNTATLVNMLTIVEGKKCVLTQIGVGKKSFSPFNALVNAVSFAASWYATYEDAPVWNDRKEQPTDDYPHQTDRTLAQFREWFDSFKYGDGEPPKRSLRVVA